MKRALIGLLIVAAVGAGARFDASAAHPDRPRLHHDGTVVDARIGHVLGPRRAFLAGEDSDRMHAAILAHGRPNFAPPSPRAGSTVACRHDCSEVHGPHSESNRACHAVQVVD